MFYDHRFSKKIIDNPNNDVVIYYGDLVLFTQTKNRVLPDPFTGTNQSPHAAYHASPDLPTICLLN